MSISTLDYIVALIIAVVLHEFAHGAVAWALGDTTAQRAGRLTLNPIKNVDPQGTILLPLVLAAGQLATSGHVSFMYGWARPVPVQPMQLRLNGVQYPRQLMAVVALAGPLMNFALAILGGLLMYVVPAPDFLFRFMIVNLTLAIFNLIPLPPFDGGRVAVGLLPLPAARLLARGEKLGIVLVLLALFVLPTVLSQFGVHFNPVSDGLGQVDGWALQKMLQFTGHGGGDANGI